MAQQRLYVRVVGILVTLVDPIVVAEFAGYRSTGFCTVTGFPLLAGAT